ncbi:coiled-coil domain-containing protein 81-like [Dendronephthya gigantea]|uniref:coiled-coil domain-containing protein 81-like n=1 Tax=Dendronephthya gigantea TaxID=151771 RepID=UPI00106CED5D|nr:coiled-coil domain-containing protein 81-like [Dendronephthya gigantea]
MSEVESSLFSEVKKNKFSSIAKFSEEDVAAVWEIVSRFVEKQMASQKGVNIPGLGSFTFSQRNLDTGNGRTSVMQRPVFQLAEKFAQTHGLNYTKHYVTGQIPIIPLNFTAIASELPYPREIVESCIKEVLQAVSRSLHVRRNVEFIFTGIGCLSIRDARAKMKFYKEFIRSMDHTGELVNALRNRPDTTDSVFTEVSFRPDTGNTVILPRININAEDKREEENTGNTPPESRNSRKFIANNGDDNPVLAPIEELKYDERLATPVSAVLTPPKTPTRAKLLASESKQSPVIPDNPNEVPHRPQSSPHSIRLRQLSRLSRSRNGSPAQGQGQTSPPKSSGEKIKKVVVKSPESKCCHSNKAGQELCYLCHQRSRKNIPIYLAEENKRCEQDDDRCLQQYQHTKDLNAVLREQANQLTNRKINQETAAFNLGVAEAIKEKKNTRPLEFHRSFLFRNRALTPPYSFKQAEYSSQLQKQVEEKNQFALKEKSDQEFQDRLEQVKLAEELAQQREQYLRDKKFDEDHYRDALNAQLQFKSLPLPVAEPDSAEPIFGKNDGTPEKFREKRERARKLYHDQLAMVADRKRAAILHDITAQSEESEMLDKIKKELQLDRAEHFYESLKTRRDLEKSWAENLRRKQEREHEEILRLRSPGVLIQEQCDKYHRCEQCGRRPWNCGESNIWRESRYISGSRLIV